MQAMTMPRRVFRFTDGPPATADNATLAPAIRPMPREAVDRLIATASADHLMALLWRCGVYVQRADLRGNPDLIRKVAQAVASEFFSDPQLAEPFAKVASDALSTLGQFVKFSDGQKTTAAGKLAAGRTRQILGMSKLGRKALAREGAGKVSKFADVGVGDPTEGVAPQDLVDAANFDMLRKMLGHCGLVISGDVYAGRPDLLQKIADILLSDPKIGTEVAAMAKSSIESAIVNDPTKKGQPNAVEPSAAGATQTVQAGAVQTFADRSGAKLSDKRRRELLGATNLGRSILEKKGGRR